MHRGRTQRSSAQSNYPLESTQSWSHWQSEGHSPSCLAKKLDQARHSRADRELQIQSVVYAPAFANTGLIENKGCSRCESASKASKAERGKEREVVRSCKS